MIERKRCLTVTTLRRTYRAAPLIAAALLAGCNAAPTEGADAAPTEGADAAPTEGADAGPVDGPSAGGGLRFATEQDALEWVAQRAGELELGTTRVERDESGRLTKVAGVSIGSPEENARKKTQLMGELGGEDRTIEIAGQRIVLEDPAPRAKIVAAHCSGDLCTNDESFKNNYYFYRELGSRTSVTSGGFETQRQTLTGSPYYECVDLPGPLPVTCKGYCNYAAGCPSGFTVESAVGYPTCQTTCVGQVRNVTLSISIMGFEFFEDSGILLQSIPERSGTTHDSSLEVTYWEYGVNFDSVIASADGLCGSHSTSGPGGLVVAKSHWGSVPNTCQ